MQRNLVIENEKLMEEWDYKKNNVLNLFPDKLSCGTHKKAWWKCKNCGNEWFASIGHRSDNNRPTNCPKCSSIVRAKNKQLNLQNESNIAKLYPYLLNEWDYTKNTISPYNITKGSHDRIWWKCENNHSWQTAVGNRIKGHGCPYCTGRFAVKGENDLQTINPTLAQEWNFERNGNLTPDIVKPSSNKKVWWKCKNGHEWQASINNRNKNRGCPICSLNTHVSIPEKALCYYLSTSFTIEENKKIPNSQMELDLFIPSLNLAIEYDGKNWHQDIARDLIKDEYCFTNGIELLRIREKGTPTYETTATLFLTDSPDSELKYLKPILKRIIEFINNKYNLSLSIPINIDDDYGNIIAQIEKYDYINSLAYRFPNLLCEWDYEKNKNLKPENVSAGSSRKVWWKCKYGHEWKTVISNRTNVSNRNQCPYCQHRKTDVGVNDIVTLKCDFLKDWDYTKNKIPPNQYMATSGKRVWWKCSNCGFEWETSIDQRRNHGCRICSRKEAGKKRSRKVMNTDTNKVFNSVVEAATYYNIQSNTITRVCRGDRKTGGGYHWKYVD